MTNGMITVTSMTLQSSTIFDLTNAEMSITTCDFTTKTISVTNGQMTCDSSTFDSSTSVSLSALSGLTMNTLISTGNKIKITNGNAIVATTLTLPTSSGDFTFELTN